MTQLIGEFECKLDAKGRMVLPAALKRQMPHVERDGLVVNRGFEKHLVFYPREEWDLMTAKLAKLNQFDPKVRAFVRAFSLLEFAGITTELVLACQFNKIEVWSKEGYDNLMGDVGVEDISSLAAEVMGDINFGI